MMEKLRRGAAPDDAHNELKEMAKSDLLVKIDYVEFAKELKKKRYVQTVNAIDKGVTERDVKKLAKVHEDLSKDTDFPNRSVLLNRVSEALHRLTLSQLTLSFEQWQEVWTVISLRFPKMTSILKETLDPPKRKVVRTDGLTLVIYVTGDSADHVGDNMVGGAIYVGGKIGKLGRNAQVTKLSQEDKKKIVDILTRFGFKGEFKFKKVVPKSTKPYREAGVGQ